jgi:hypothetical protein
VEKETKTLQTQDAARFRYLWAQKTAIKQEKKNRKKQRNCWKRTFLILDFGLHIVNGIAALHLKRDRLSCQSLHKDLHLEDPREAIQILKLKTGKTAPESSVRSSATAVTRERERERERRHISHGKNKKEEEWTTASALT